VVISYALIFLVLMPLIMSPVILLVSHKWRYFLMISIISLMIMVSLYQLTGIEWGSLYLFGGEGEGALSWFFKEHAYSNIAAFGFVLVGALAILYGLETAKPTEQAVALIAVASAAGIVYSGDFVTLFIFWELLTITTAALILLNRNREAYHMGLRFLTMHLGGGLLLLLGILQHYSATGSLEVAVPEAGLAFFVAGIGFKAAFLPVHLWVAWGYPSASFSSSVVLAGLTTKIGVFAIARILPDHQVIAFMGACMAIFGFTCALLQKDMRKLLSYHIISQVGYMVAGAGLGTALLADGIAVDGSLLHMVNHMLYKALLFMCAGAVIYTTGGGNLHNLHHGDKNLTPVWRALPLVTAGAVVGALAISGFPPFNGFVSKYLLKNAMYDMQPMETMLLIASVGTPLSFCKLLYFGFFNARARIYRQLPKTLMFAIITVATLCLLLGIQPQLLSDLLPYSDYTDYSLQNFVYSFTSVIEGILLVLSGILVFVLLARVLERGIKPPAWMSIEGLIFNPVSKYSLNLFCKAGNYLDSSVNELYTRTGENFLRVSKMISKIDSSIDTFYTRGGRTAYRLAEKARTLDGSIDNAYERTGHTAYRLADRSNRLDEALNQAYEKSGHTARDMAKAARHLDEGVSHSYDKTGEGARRLASGDYPVTSSQKWDPFQWTIQNLNFDNFLMALVLGIILLVFFYFGRA